MNNIEIRPFSPETDLPGAYACFYEGFQHTMWPIMDNSNEQFIIDLILLVDKMSTTGFVAEINGEVGALIFGSAPVKAGNIAGMAGFSTFRMAPGLLFNSYKFNSTAYANLALLGYGFAPFLWHHPFAWPMAEVNLFTSRRSCRGKGVGKKLMDGFIAEVRKQDMQGAYVCTDTALSYHFYEAYGFSRKAEFPMKAYKHSLPGQDYLGRVYYLPIKNGK